MRIGLDCRTTAGPAGVAQYGRHLRDALLSAAGTDRYEIFGPQADPIPFWTAHFSDRRRFVRAKLDLLHVLGGAAPYGYRHPYVLTVHDLAIYRHRDWFPEGQWFSTRVSYPNSIKLARRIIVPSCATKADLIDLFKVKEEKIAVIPHGASVPSLRGEGEEIPSLPRSTELARNDDHKYILYIGTIEPRKNIPVLVHAYRRLIDMRPELKETELRLAGAAGWKSDDIVDEIRKTQCEGYRIVMEGEVSEERKWDLLRSASCLAYPSFHEGFGMPVTEAFACGVPVVASDAAALVEVSGGAALHVAAADAEGWARALEAALTDGKTAGELREKGIVRSGDFSWEKTALLTREAYRSVIA
jgi:glycosyltransferase involved in cell wall biosynthesis